MTQTQERGIADLSQSYNGPPSAVAKAYPREEDISVAVLYPGSRVDKILGPLRATDMDVAVTPPDAYRRDIALIDNADRYLIIPVVRKTIANAKVVYRMRGDLYRELELWDMHPLKKWAATKVVVGNVDAVLSVNKMLADKARKVSGVPSAGVAGLAKDPDNWPTHDHKGTELRCVTLTNADYIRKVRPILDWAETVEEAFDEFDGRWRVCGKGEYEDKLAAGLADYEHVSFEGYVDAFDTLQWANCMLHPSRLDGLPNSILEGMASRMPVITNDFEAFTAYGGPVGIAASEYELRAMLDAAQDPDCRNECGQRCLDHVREHHSPEVVGQEYVRYFQQLLGLKWSRDTRTCPN